MTLGPAVLERRAGRLTAIVCSVVAVGSGVAAGNAWRDSAGWGFPAALVLLVWLFVSVHLVGSVRTLLYPASVELGARGVTLESGWFLPWGGVGAIAITHEMGTDVGTVSLRFDGDLGEASGAVKNQTFVCALSSPPVRYGWAYARQRARVLARLMTEAHAASGCATDRSARVERRPSRIGTWRQWFIVSGGLGGALIVIGFAVGASL